MASSSDDCQVFREGIESLPNEILLMIFNQLPPSILVQLVRSEIGRVRQVCVLTSDGDFRPCPLISKEAVWTYISSKRHALTELYADELVCVNQTILVNGILLCRQLKLLSIRHAGVTFNGVTKIFSKLENIRDFRWSTEVDPSAVLPRFQPVKGIKFWDNLTVDIHNCDQFELFLERFSFLAKNLEKLEFNFYVVPVDSKPELFNTYRTILDELRLSSLKITFPANLTNGHLVSREYRDRIEFPRLMRCHSASLLKKCCCKTFWLHDYLSQCASFSSSTEVPRPELGNILLQGFYDILGCLKPNSLEVFGSVAKLNYENVEALCESGGFGLKSLTFASYLSEVTEESDLVAEPRLFLLLMIHCRNITHLDCRAIHIPSLKEKSFCDSICHLKNLKKLCLPVCAVECCIPAAASTSNPSRRKRTRYDFKTVDMQSSFTDLISSCPLVEEFTLSNCTEMLEPKETLEKTLSSLSRWSHLKKLRLDFVEGVRLCSFLVDVGKMCKELESVSLINIGHESVFHFTPSLCSLFRNSSSLKYIKIVHKSFNINDKLFWDGLCEASILESLCVATKFRMTINTSIVANCIEKLKQFQSFHVQCDSEPVKALKTKLNSILGSRFNLKRGGADVILKKSKTDHLDRVLEPTCPKMRCCWDTTL